jgi:hypothetical protein
MHLSVFHSRSLDHSGIATGRFASAHSTALKFRLNHDVPIQISLLFESKSVLKFSEYLKTSEIDSIIESASD